MLCPVLPYIMIRPVQKIKFHAVVYRHYSGKVENVYIFGKFIQETMYQISA